MTITETCYEHIIIDELGVPYIAGTTMKVIELVGEKFAFGWSPEEFLFQHPYNTWADSCCISILLGPHRRTG